MTTIVPESACANTGGEKRAIHRRKTSYVKRKLAFNGVPTHRDSGTAILYAADHALRMALDSLANLSLRCRILYASSALINPMTPKTKTSGSGVLVASASGNGLNPERERVFEAFREWGYLEGDLDPLGFLRPRVVPELHGESPYAAEARAIYCSTIGVEVNHIYSPERRQWIYDRMEAEPPEKEDQQRILDLLIRADI